MIFHHVLYLRRGLPDWLGYHESIGTEVQTYRTGLINPEL